MRTITIILMGVCLPGVAGAVVLNPGDVVVSDATREAVVKVDPATGSETVISGCFSVPDCPGGVVGSGPPFDGLGDGIGVTSDLQTVYVVDDMGDDIFGVDVATGERTLVLSSTSFVQDLAVAPASPTSLSSLPTWGIAVLAGILLGLGMKRAPRSLAQA